jgi:hypothetical protein
MSWMGQLRKAGIESDGSDVDLFRGRISAQNFPGITQGDIYHVMPSGDDGYSGKKVTTPLKTLAAALAKASENQNDIIRFYAEGNASALCTDYQAAQLDWDKDFVHLVGIHTGGNIAPRARISAASAYAAADPIFKLSANGCFIKGMQVFLGVADATPLGSTLVTGQRNVLEDCHLAGIGNDANDIAGAYSLKLDAAAENLFRRCMIGLSTIDRGSANSNYEILVDGSAPRNAFEDCVILSRIEHATYHPQVYLNDATAMQDYLRFLRCEFINLSTNYGYTNGGVFKFGATPTNGYVIVKDCSAYGASKWDVGDLNKILISNSPIAIGDTAGIGYAV